MKRPLVDDAIDRIRDMRRLSTDAERLLWKYLRGRQLVGRKFPRQVWLGSYIVDVVCLDDRLVIEADGSQHSSQADYDARRTAWLESAGFRVMRFWNHEVLTNVSGVLRMIEAALESGPSPSHSPRGERAPPSPQMGEGS